MILFILHNYKYIYGYEWTWLDRISNQPVVTRKKLEMSKKIYSQCRFNNTQLTAQRIYFRI